MRNDTTGRETRVPRVEDREKGIDEDRRGGWRGWYIDYRDTERALSSSHGGRKLARRCIAVTSIRNSHLRIACPTCFVTGRDSACYPHGINVSRPLFPTACKLLSPPPPPPPSPLSIGQPLSAVSFSPASRYLASFHPDSFVSVRSTRQSLSLSLSLCPSADRDDDAATTLPPRCSLEASTADARDVQVIITSPGFPRKRILVLRLFIRCARPRRRETIVPIISFLRRARVLFRRQMPNVEAAREKGEEVDFFLEGKFALSSSF